MFYRNLRQGWEKTREIRKTHGNGKNWILPGKMRKTGKIVFFQNAYLKKHVKSLTNK
jgi:hypothetical protein